MRNNGKEDEHLQESPIGDSYHINLSEEGEQSRPIHSQFDNITDDEHPHHTKDYHHHHHNHHHHSRSSAHHETPAQLPENQLGRKHSRRKNHRRRSSHHRRSKGRRQNSGREVIYGATRGDDANDVTIRPSRSSSITRDENGSFRYRERSHRPKMKRNSSSNHRRRNRSRDYRRRDRYHEKDSEYYVHENEHYNSDEDTYSDDPDTERSESPEEFDEIESFSASSLPTVFRRAGVGGSIRDDLSEITNIFSFNKKHHQNYDFDDSSDDESTGDSGYKLGLPNNGCTIIFLICAVIVVSVATALLIVVGASQEIDAPTSALRQPKTPKNDNSTSLESSSPTSSPSPISNETSIRSIIAPPSLEECDSIAAGKEYFGSSLTDHLTEGYFAVDMGVHVRNQVPYRGNNFVRFVLPEIEIAIQSKLLPLLAGCQDEWTRRRLVTEYPILNAKVINLYKQDGRCIQTPVSCYKISVELRLTFIEMGPPNPIIAKITRLFTEQTMVEQIGLDSMIEDTDTTDVRKLDSPPSNPPTMMPTDVPSFRPTNEPSKAPTIPPTTVSPTPEPSKYPSSSPTETPSAIPTRSPTNKPSRDPTPFPTVSPTASPSVAASTKPTGMPSADPSMSPSMAASTSLLPSTGPSAMMSVRPSSFPSTSAPTITDSSVPSRAPSSKPSFQSSYNPTASLYPSFRPSATSP